MLDCTVAPRDERRSRLGCQLVVGGDAGRSPGRRPGDPGLRRDGRGARRHRRSRAGRRPGRRLPATRGLRRRDHCGGRRARPALPASTAVEGLPGRRRATLAPPLRARVVLRRAADRPAHRRARSHGSTAAAAPSSSTTASSCPTPLWCSPPAPPTAASPSQAPTSPGCTSCGRSPTPRRLRRALGTARSAVVVGAGFIGLEFAAAARKRGIDVTVLEAADRPLARALSPRDGATTSPARTGAWAPTCGWGRGCPRSPGRGRTVVAAVGTSGRMYPADLVVLGVGVRPRDELARAAGPGGRRRDRRRRALRTTDPDIYAVGRLRQRPGDLPARGSGWSPCRTRPTRAGGPPTRSSAGAAGTAEVPWFWSNQGPLRLQIAGVRRPDDDTVVTGDVAGGRFSVFCFRDERLVAVESLNKPADHLAARRVLANDDRPTPEQVADPDFSLKDHVQAARRHGELTPGGSAMTTTSPPAPPTPAATADWVDPASHAAGSVPRPTTAARAGPGGPGAGDEPLPGHELRGMPAHRGRPGHLLGQRHRQRRHDGPGARRAAHAAQGRSRTTRRAHADQSAHATEADPRDLAAVVRAERRDLPRGCPGAGPHEADLNRDYAAPLAAQNLVDMLGMHGASPRT